MIRTWSLIWLAAAVGGMAIMVFAYRQAADASGSSRGGRVLFVAKQPEAKADLGSPVSVCFLPADDAAEALANAFGGTDRELADSFRQNHQQMVILRPDFEQSFAENMLASGRLPEAGAKEVLADPQSSSQAPIRVGDETLQVVGVLKNADSLHLNACYAADNPAMREMLEKSGTKLTGGYLISRKDLSKVKEIEKQFPHKRFMAIVHSPRMNKADFYNYVLGTLLFLLGGSGLFVRLYIFAAGRSRDTWIGAPLGEISRHWKLFSLLHAVYFGLFITGTLVIYDAPLIQDLLGTAIQGQIESRSGVLGIAGQAYESRNIAVAAITTLAINFFLGSLMVITLPSIVVPGIGVLMAVFRATVWGVLLAATSMTLARGMIFHTGTLLLEGEGYILAAFFGLLVPIYLFSPGMGKTAWGRYGQAVVMNLKGNLIVLAVLAAAALYEAIEVIFQMGG